MRAFENMDVKENNFFALMFFVVAIVNLVNYFFCGWAANEIGQVRSLFL